MGDLVIHDVHHPAKIQKKMLHILRDQGIIVTNHPVRAMGNGTTCVTRYKKLDVDWKRYRASVQ